MTIKIAVMVIHGIGSQTKEFYYDIRDNLLRHFTKIMQGTVRNPTDELVVEPVWWAPVLMERDMEFQRRIDLGGRTGFRNLRAFVLNTAADAVAYQPIPKNRVIYDNIHDVVAQAMNTLAQSAGPNAPLCIVAHSLGSIIISNYIWDLQNHEPMTRPLISAQVAEEIENTPLEQGETLAHLYTLGSPISLWSLRWCEYDYGTPIAFPPPKLHEHYPDLWAEWVNFYDKDDVIGYPLRGLNKKYEMCVAEDREVNVGDWMQHWNPLSHHGYWNARQVYEPIAEALAKTWKTVNCWTE